MKKAALWMMLAALLFMLCSCAQLDELSQSDALPDLRLLVQPAYEEPETVEKEPEAASSAMRLDLWLDGSQTMGGINPNEESMYPHSSRKYREGGFHYRYQRETGMYETVLRCMLSGVEGSRVRLLRYGNERLPDDYLLNHIKRDATTEELRSIRRDMLTYAIDPLPSIFEGFSAEKMTDSFYSLGTPQMNRIGTLNRRLLENPDYASSMEQTLEQQIHAISRGYDDSLTAIGDDSDYPLLYALNNLDLSRLSVITCDPASIRRLTQTDDDGDVRALVQELLTERGVFENGLSVGLYAFTLDYMGQMSSFASADLSEPLLWGRLNYNNYTGKTDGHLVMPRTLLTLVIGRQGQVDAFTAAFEKQLAASDTLKIPRGAQNGELTYTRDGQTVVQEPFGFSYDYLTISRAAVEPITQQTEGVTLTADAPVTLSGSLHTVTLAPVDGVQPDRTLTLSLPVSETAGGMTLDAEKLTNVQLSVESALLWTDTLPNHPSAEIPEDAQTIVLRDKVYVFTKQQAECPVLCKALSVEGNTLTMQLETDGAKLQNGYYRIRLTADLPGESLTWNTPAWVSERSTTVTNEQVASWEAFAEVLSRYERDRNYISVPFQHAWGDAENTSYRGETVPEFPPVTLAPGLSALVSQLQTAAHPRTIPYLSFVFDLFVNNQ